MTIETYIPCRGTVVGLCSIMVAIAMSSEEEDLILNIGWGLAVQTNHLVIKSLPLGRVV